MSLQRFNDSEKLVLNIAEYVQENDPAFELIGYEADIERICSILGKESQNNIILTGLSGVGKSAILQGIAKRRQQAIENPQKASEMGIPLHMVGREFLKLDVDALFDFEDPEKIKADIKRVFKELDKPGDHVLVIEDTNDFFRGIENHQTFGLMSSFMRKLRHKDFQTIWMVRDEVGKNRLDDIFDRHSEIRELFTVVEKKEPKEDEIKNILQARKVRLEGHFEGLHITDEALEEVIKLPHLYPNLSVWTRHQPARSLDLLDRIASKFVSRAQTKPPELETLEEALAELDAAHQDNKDDRDYLRSHKELTGQIDEIRAAWADSAAKLYTIQAKMSETTKTLDSVTSKLEDENTALREKLEQEFRNDPDKKNEDVTDFDLNQRKTEKIRKLEEQLRSVNNDIQRIQDVAAKHKQSINNQFTLSKDAVDQIFGEITGIPVADLDEDESEKILNLDREIKESVFGQDESVDIVSNTIKSAKAGLKSPKRPMGIFICLGSSGVGKSYLAEIVASKLYGDKQSMTTFDMSEFMEKHTVSQLKGAPPGYAGYGEGGRLTNAVRSKPYQAILLDEVEKAHKDVFKILLQVFNDGRLSDELGTAKFNNTVFFLTTNLGQHLALEGEIDPASPEGREAVIHELRAHFPQELLNRVDEFLLFNTLEPEHIAQVIHRDIRELNKTEALEDKNIQVNLPEEDIHAIIEDKYRREEGARQVQKFIENRMSAGLVPILLKQPKGSQGGTIEVRYNRKKNGFDYEFVAEDGQKPQAGANNNEQQPLRQVAGSHFAQPGLKQ